MKKISLSSLDRDCYVETLDNGLEVYMIPFVPSQTLINEVVLHGCRM